MSYFDMTVRSIYGSISSNMHDNFTQAEAWVEAENVFAVRAYLGEWFAAMESGTANSRYPDPFGKVYSQKYCDRLISALDEDFEREHGRFIHLGVDTGPEYSRLSSSARQAFVQGLWKIMLSQDEIRKSALCRLAKGEQLPPPDVYSYENSLTGMLYDDDMLPTVPGIPRVDENLPERIRIDYYEEY